jgi:hypothetical protein
MDNLEDKLYKMQIGSLLNIKNKVGELEGAFIRIPSGWIYRYVFRGQSSCCFIPYTEDIKYWDHDLELGSCPYCRSIDIVLIKSDITSQWHVCCGSCQARGPERDMRRDAVENWNKVRIRG